MRQDNNITMKIHFVGIGGIGVSALARYYLKKGHKVSGSDLFSSKITGFLEKTGAKIFIGPHKTSNLEPNLDLLIFSQAVTDDNPELKEAKNRGVRCLSYPEALGELTKEYFTIAVCGAHGKGTTTAMISLILIEAGLDPTVIIGTELEEFDNTNCRVGDSQYLVIEADEYKEAFSNYWPKIIVLTNIDREHLDYYRDLDHIIKSFGEFIKHLPNKGTLVLNKDNKGIASLLQKYSIFSTIVENLLYYSLEQLEQKEVESIKGILKIPGEHNVSNALAALTLARSLNIPDEISLRALSQYKGAWRRFEIRHVTWNMKHITLISDYAHHPTEIEATLTAAKEKFPQRKIWCVFQPHQFQRTFYLFGDFVRVFAKAPLKKLIIADIYEVAGRESQDISRRVSSEELIGAIRKPFALYLPKEKITRYLKDNLEGEEVLIFMGAGDIYKLSENFSLAEE